MILLKCTCQVKLSTTDIIFSRISFLVRYWLAGYRLPLFRLIIIDRSIKRGRGVQLKTVP